MGMFVCRSWREKPGAEVEEQQQWRQGLGVDVTGALSILDIDSFIPMTSLFSS